MIRWTPKTPLMSKDQARDTLQALRDTLTREKIDAALDPDDSRASTLWSLGLWAGFAAAFLSLAVIATRSESGQSRMASLSDGRAFGGQDSERNAALTMQAYEVQRLATIVRGVAAERELLSNRLETLEKNAGDITASVGPRGTVRNITEQRPAAEVASLPQSTVAGADSTVIRTEFAVDLASETTIEALRARWGQLRAQQSAQLDGLKPLVAVRDGQKPGTVELHLIAGPLSNANAAARLCVTLGNAGLDCKPTVFDGQRLALR
jgi:hypothetical protein